MNFISNEYKQIITTTIKLFIVKVIGINNYLYMLKKYTKKNQNIGVL